MLPTAFGLPFIKSKENEFKMQRNKHIDTEDFSLKKKKIRETCTIIYSIFVRSFETMTCHKYRHVTQHNVYFVNESLYILYPLSWMTSKKLSQLSACIRKRFTRSPS